MSDGAPTLDDLNSLNYEIAALVRAGVPLEFGLQGLSGIKRSQFSQLAARIAERLRSGMTLPDAVEAEGVAISPSYVAVMKAGLASGKLPQALESFTVSGQIIQDTRSRIWLAAIYPLFAIAFAYLLSCFFITQVVPKILSVAEMVPNNWVMNLLKMARNNHQIFTFYIPFTFVLAVIVLFLFRNSLTRPLWFYFASFRWIIGRSLNWMQFTELLAMQIEHGVPLPEAFVLSADATDDVEWHHQARVVADRLNSGNSLAEALKTAYRLPPVIRWMLASAEKQGQLVPTLRQLSELYQRQALRRAAIVKIWVPVTMTLVVTVTIGLSYTLALFIPLKALLLDLMKE